MTFIFPCRLYFLKYRLITNIRYFERKFFFDIFAAESEEKGGAHLDITPFIYDHSKMINKMVKNSKSLSHIEAIKHILIFTICAIKLSLENRHRDLFPGSLFCLGRNSWRAIFLFLFYSQLDYSQIIMNKKPAVLADRSESEI